MEVRLYKATNRNTQCYWVDVGNTSILFSYQTAIAVQTPRGKYRIENSWGPTTGRHFSDSNADSWPVISIVELEEKIHASIRLQFLEPLLHKVLHGDPRAGS